MSNEIVKVDPLVLAKIITTGDLTGLTYEQQTQYYFAICERVGLDPTTKPFDLLKLNGKLVLYANKGATQQLSDKHKISHEITKKETVNGVYIVTVRAIMGDRYTDEDGAVTIDGLKGDALANAIMKAATKAKRRAVLALLGLNMLDESELETIPAKAIESAQIAVGFDDDFKALIDSVNSAIDKDMLMAVCNKFNQSTHKSDAAKRKAFTEAKDAKKKELGL